MKACLNCQKEYINKRGTSKFCSTSCRVSYHRKNPQLKKAISPMQMQVLYNAVLEAVDKIQFATPGKVYDSPKMTNIQDEPPSFDKMRHQADLPTFQSLLNGMANLLFADDKNEYELKIRSAKHLTDKQRELLLNNLRNLRF